MELTDSQKKAIKKKYAGGKSIRRLALQYGVSWSTVHELINSMKQLKTDN